MEPVGRMGVLEVVIQFVTCMYKIRFKVRTVGTRISDKLLVTDKFKKLHSNQGAFLSCECTDDLFWLLFINYSS